MRCRWGPGCGRTQIEEKRNEKWAMVLWTKLLFELVDEEGNQEKAVVSKRTFLTCSDKWKWGYSARDRKNVHTHQSLIM